MIRILFVCHGNICRSPMAENVFRERALAAGLQVLSDSAAVSAEELGSGMYPAAREKLRREGGFWKGRITTGSIGFTAWTNPICGE